MGVENPYYRRSIKQTSYAKRACWYYPTTNTEDTDMEDVEYRVEIYNILRMTELKHMIKLTIFMTTKKKLGKVLLTLHR
jgi:hypothetical protein